jgi:hypothetical protein
MSETSSTVTTVINKSFAIDLGDTEIVDLSDIEVVQSLRIDTDEAVTAEIQFQDDSVVSQPIGRRFELTGVQITALSITAGAVDATVYVSLIKNV